jgi:hypothetical protein
VAIGIAALAVVVSAPPVAAKQTAVVSPPIVDGLAGPLQFEVSWHGRVLVGQSFAGIVTKIDRDGARTDLFTDPGVDGVARGRFGSVIYTHTDFETGVIDLRVRTPSGDTKIIADLIGHERAKNPDGRQRYGLRGLTPECAAQLPPDAGVLPYHGIVDSHPYAVTPTKWGWLVADAGGNDILFVSWHGRVKTVAVLPPQEPVLVTAEIAASNELPPCVAGASFIAEPVPTDVEVGRDGYLYVSTLPGGPEDPSLGARGSVYKVSPRSGRSYRIATGFAGATNLAVTPWGTIYVSELFGGKVSKVIRGKPYPIAELNEPSGLEWNRGKLYVGTDSFGSGKIQTISFH